MHFKTGHKQTLSILSIATLILMGSFNFENSLTGQGSGNRFGDISGSYSFKPSYTLDNSQTRFTPSFSRYGDMGSLSHSTGVNTYGLGVNHQLNPSTSIYGSGGLSSNGHSSFMGGVRFDF